MPLGYGAITIEDVFFELYGRTPNPGETYNLTQLASMAGLPSNLLAFRGFVGGTTTVEVVATDIINSYDYVSVTWEIHFSRALPDDLNVNMKETYDSSGTSYTYPMQITAGTTVAQFLSYYMKEADTSYSAMWEVMPGTGYTVGANNLASVLVPQMSQFPSSSSSLY